MHLVVAGINHERAPVEMRERLAIDPMALSGALDELCKHNHIDEACIVSTCNRIEIYAVCQSRADDALLIDFLARQGGMRADVICACVYLHAGHHAVKHLFDVACGLDSMALGETQIQSQIKQAYCTAHDCNATGPGLNTLFQRAIAVGKRARSETEISCGSLSIGAAAVDLAKFVLGDLKDKSVLLVGAGKMGKLAITHLRNYGVIDISIASRTTSTTRELADQCKAKAVPFEEMEKALSLADLVICSTGAPHTVLSKDIVLDAIALRPDRPLYIIDIAVPRDVEPDAADAENVFVYNIDDLQCLVDQCKDQRQSQIENVNRIVEEELAAFMNDFRTMEAVPIIKELRNKCEVIVESELNRCLAQMPDANEAQQAIIRKALKSTITKLIHHPIINMKEYAAEGDEGKLEIIRELFGLD